MCQELFHLLSSLTDENFNSCDKLEEDYSQLEFIHNKFTEGSIVWAKMQGFPWWPAMVETDPDRGEFMLHNGIDSDVVSKGLFSSFCEEEHFFWSLPTFK